ncbi:SRPBCC family protein [Rhodanobacter sp. Col0626]|uniref:SRPBCC family protein n=1 Tax=Rhodanobacter sp. Col0626 TaxID=3415679 RepID=UPI003CE73222
MNHHSIPTSFEHSTTINAPVECVWDSLTDIEQMKAWMGDPDMALKIDADWVIGSPMVVKGVHYAPFKNTGTVLAFEPTTCLAYTHLSSLSRLPDQPSSYTTLEFRMALVDDATSLKLRASGFPTASIFKHLEFYWGGTLEILKRHVERRQIS